MKQRSTKVGGPVASLVAVAALLLSPTFARAETPDPDIASLEQALVEFANTPREHRALAGYFRARAQGHRDLAERHRVMGRSHVGLKPVQARMQRTHCERIVAVNEELASEYDGLAQGHQKAAAN